MTKSLIEEAEEILALAQQLEKDAKELAIESNKIWAHGQVFTLWEVKK